MDADEGNGLGALQRQRNKETRQGWNDFESHRRVVMQLLHEAASESRRLETPSEARTPRRICPIQERDIESCRAAARAMRLPAEWNAHFHVAGSLCLLSQLIESVTLALGENHPCLLDVLADVRRRHLQLLVELIRPGGTAILITDIVSTDTFPQLGQIPLDQLPGVVGRLIQERNFFTGLNPFVIRSLFETDPQLAAEVTATRLTHPWLWHLGPRTYAVCAIIVRRRTLP